MLIYFLLTQQAQQLMMDAQEMNQGGNNVDRKNFNNNGMRNFGGNNQVSVSYF